MADAFDVEADLSGGVRTTFNAAPTQALPVVVTRPQEHGPPRRELRTMTWGLVPSWSKERTGGAKMINARSETVLERPAYRRAAAARRCLVPADGWYEWRAPSERGGRKQPHFMSLAAGGPLALAGLYELWRPKGDDEADWLVTFAVLTREAEPALAAVHDRMPLVLPRAAWEGWLDPALTAPDAVAGLLDAARTEPPGRFTAVPVDARVGSVRQDDAELVTPVGPPLPGQGGG